MKRWIRYVVLAELVTFVFLVARRGYPDYVAAREAANREKTKQWLASVIVPT